jgi:hypothetical protein
VIISSLVLLLYRPPVFHTIDRIARAPTTKQNQKKQKKNGTSRPDLARLRRNKKQRKVFLNEMDRRYKIAEPFTKLTDWKGKNQQTRQKQKKTNRNINYNT